MKVYLAGGITGVPDYHEKFAEGAHKLRLEGHEVFNPAAANLEGLPLRKILAYETSWICHEAEAIALLQGWSYSLGARAEHALGLALGLKIILL